jgi:hypothetical protein
LENIIEIDHEFIMRIKSYRTEDPVSAFVLINQYASVILKVIAHHAQTTCGQVLLSKCGQVKSLQQFVHWAKGDMSQKGVHGQLKQIWISELQMHERLMNLPRFSFIHYWLINLNFVGHSAYLRFNSLTLN